MNYNKAGSFPLVSINNGLKNPVECIATFGQKKNIVLHIAAIGQAQTLIIVGLHSILCDSNWQ